MTFKVRLIGEQLQVTRQSRKNYHDLIKKLNDDKAALHAQKNKEAKKLEDKNGYHMRLNSARTGGTSAIAGAVVDCSMASPRQHSG